MAKKKEEATEISNPILDELRKLVRLAALSLTKGRTQREQIYMMADAGMNRNEIASLVGTSAGTVSVELSNRKDKKR
ncbi:MAG TPA: hypothetical protein VK738_21350 [Terriglobales bacterium]|jgi:hypothetical protein|nr:hypothetical protein [Terriglobales bacterium]